MLVIEGNSGTGKTYFAKHLIHSIYEENNEITSIYIDLNSDEFTTLLFAESLIYTAWEQQELDFNHLLNINKKKTFFHFLKNSNLKRRAIESIVNVVSNSVELLPSFGKPLKGLFPKNLFTKNRNDPTPDVMITLCKYLEFITKENNAYLIIDNYQFLPIHTKTLFESHVSKIHHSLNLVIINRTDTISEKLGVKSLFIKDHSILRFESFCLKEVQQLVSMSLDLKQNEIEIFSKFCFEKTKGNLKEIELLLKTYRDPTKKENIFDIKETISFLPYIKKYLVTIVSLFPAGMKKQYVFEFLKYILDGNDQTVIEETINDLIKIGYIIVNSKNGQLIKPAHEKIITSSQKGLSDSEIVQIRQDLMCVMEDILNRGTTLRDYSYLLHCFVGIFTVEQYKNKLNYVIRLFDIQYKNNMYHYIVMIFKEYKEIITLLPEISIFQMLDSFQKTSEIYLGLEAISLIKDLEVSKKDKISLYKVKYLTQSYNFQEALEIINELNPENEEVLLYKLNIYQHLCMDNEAKIIIRGLNYQQSDSYHVILRNSAHYFNYEDAVRNLKKVYNYFNQKNFIFGKSSAINNLAVVHIWKGNLIEAEELLNKSIDLFNQINSNEVFEPLCNMAALCVLNKNYTKARSYVDMAITAYPKSLLFDQIMLSNNLLTIQLALKEIELQEMRRELIHLYNSATTIGDPWLRFQVCYNLLSIENKLNIENSYDISGYLLKKLENKEETGMEVIINVNEINLLFSLSPHWRY